MEDFLIISFFSFFFFFFLEKKAIFSSKKFRVKKNDFKKLKDQDIIYFKFFV